MGNAALEQVNTFTYLRCRTSCEEENDINSKIRKFFFTNFKNSEWFETKFSQGTI
jgi:hypothetical protein